MRIDPKKLVVAMLDRDLNQKELAEKAGISRVTVNSVKQGKTCSEHTAESIAKALGTPLEELKETN